MKRRTSSDLQKERLKRLRSHECIAAFYPVGARACTECEPSSRKRQEAFLELAFGCVPQLNWYRVNRFEEQFGEETLTYHWIFGDDDRIAVGDYFRRKLVAIVAMRARDHVIIYYFSDEKKRRDFHMSQYVPWPIAKK